MGEVVNLDVETLLDLSAERVLTAAIEADLVSAVVVGRDADGNVYFATTFASGPETLWLLEIAKVQLIDAGKPD